MYMVTGEAVVDGRTPFYLSAIVRASSAIEACQLLLANEHNQTIIASNLKATQLELSDEYGLLQMQLIRV